MSIQSKPQPGQPDGAPEPVDLRTDKADANEQAQEWGERVETGKSIARGGKTQGHVPGAADRDRSEP